MTQDRTTPKLGKLIDPDDHDNFLHPPQRDAVHIAVCPVVAGEDLNPGDRIGFILEGTRVGMCNEPVGIVDPMLEAPVKAEQSFWLWVFPGTITGLRHQWSHPAFDNRSHVSYYRQLPMPDEFGSVPGSIPYSTPEGSLVFPGRGKTDDPKEISRRWLEKFASDWNFGYQNMVSEALSDSGIITAMDRDLHGVQAEGTERQWDQMKKEDEELFWKHMEVLTGRTFSEEHREQTTWSCSC